MIFHAGTAATTAGDLVTAGGRVLAVTAAAGTLNEALSNAYRVLAQVRFAGMQFRRDIGYRALTR